MLGGVWWSCEGGEHVYMIRAASAMAGPTNANSRRSSEPMEEQNVMPVARPMVQPTPMCCSSEWMRREAEMAARKRGGRLVSAWEGWNNSSGNSGSSGKAGKAAKLAKLATPTHTQPPSRERWSEVESSRGGREVERGRARERSTTTTATTTNHNLHLERGGERWREEEEVERWREEERESGQPQPPTTTSISREVERGGEKSRR